MWRRWKICLMMSQQILSCNLYFMFYIYFSYLKPLQVNLNPFSSTQLRISFSDCILDVLALLRHHWLSPFDLVLDILDEVLRAFSWLPLRHPLQKKKIRLKNRTWYVKVLLVNSLYRDLLN